MLQRFKGNAYDLPRISPLLAPGELRSLRVIVDTDCLRPSRLHGIDAVSLLEGLLMDSAINVARVSEDGPPSVPASNWAPVPGWVLVRPVENPTPRVTHEVAYHYSGVEHGSLTCIFGDVARGSLATGDELYASLAPDEAARRRDADATLLGAAMAAHADLFVIERPFLHSDVWPWARGITIATPRDAIALLGLYMRSRSRYVAFATKDHGPTLTFNRGLSTWVTTRALLPEGWRWFSHCLYADAVESGEDMVYLAQSVFERVARCLRARDDLFVSMSLPQDNDIADDALGALDVSLVFLMGAFDALARVAHRALNLTGSARSAAWQRDRWVRRIGHEPLRELFHEGAQGSDVLTLLSALRNTVHGPAMHSVRVERPLTTRPGPETVVSLPSEEAHDLMEVLGRRNWAEEWGIEELSAGQFHAQPDQLADHLFRESVAVMNDIMRATPVERLVTTAIDHQKGRDEGPFAANVQASLLLQYGF